MAVSLALRNKPGVSSETAARIRAIAEEMGYKPNPLVSSLMRTRSSRRKKGHGLVIGWLGLTQVQKTKQGLKYDIFAEYLRGCQDAVEQADIRLEVFNRHQFPNRNAFERVLRSRGIPALVLGPWDQGHTMLIPDIKTIPHIVQIGRSRHRLDHDRVVVDHYNHMATCVQKVLDRGCRRIVWMDSHLHEERNEGRWTSSFLYQIHIRKFEGHVHLIEKRTNMNRVTKEALDRYQPDAIISGNPSVGFCLRDLQAERRIEFACLARDGQPDWMSGINVGHYRLGYQAGNIVVDKVLGSHNRREGSRGRSIVLPGEWWESSESNLSGQPDAKNSR